MDRLQAYNELRDYSPAEIPGGVRYYTGEEVSAFRTITSCGKGTPRQWDLYKKIVWEMEGGHLKVEDPAAENVDAGDTYISVSFGGVITGGLLAVLLCGSMALAGNYLIYLWRLACYYSPFSFMAMAVVLIGAIFASRKVRFNDELPNNDNWML